MSDDSKLRPPADFSKWMPVMRDQYVAYTYEVAGRTVRGQDRWMRARWRIASAALATGATEFHVRGGHGTRRWHRVVTCTEEQADAFFRHHIEKGDFMLKGEYRKALNGQRRRLEKAAR